MRVRLSPLIAQFSVAPMLPVPDPPEAGSSGIFRPGRRAGATFIGAPRPASAELKPSTGMAP